MRELLVVGLLGGSIVGIGAIIAWIIKVERSKDKSGTHGWCGYRDADEYEEAHGDKSPW